MIRPKKTTLPNQDPTSLPAGFRVSLWMLFGAALGLPVDELFEMFSLQMATAKRQLNGKRLRMTTAERLVFARVAKQMGSTFTGLLTWIVSPDSLIRWLKRYQQRKANGDGVTEPKKPGRPWIKPEKVEAILRIYDAGLTGLSRIVGEMGKCGMTVAESTVRRVLTANGRPPSHHNHRTGSTWAQFWNRHAQHLVGTDFIQMPIGLLGKIVNAHIFCAIEHDTRRVHLLGITVHPTDAWIANVLRSATMLGGPLAERRHWILDNDGKYGPQTSAVLGNRLVSTSLRAPDMNAVIERWNRSIQDECLNHVVFMSADHLRQYVESYIQHYNSERPHQGIGNKPVSKWTIGTGDMVCDESLHGLLKSFRRAA